VFVRDPDKLTINKHRLRVITGSFTEASGRLAEAMRGQDAVISALGVGNSQRSADLKNRSMPTIVAAMESQVVRRLIVISA
jgi:putative NADH-flavin reductase